MTRKFTKIIANERFLTDYNPIKIRDLQVKQWHF